MLKDDEIATREHLETSEESKEEDAQGEQLDDEDPLSIEKLIEMAGSGTPDTGLGLYQVIQSVLYIMAQNTGGFFMYLLSFLEKVPKYQCNEVLYAWDSCTAE